MIIRLILWMRVQRGQKYGYYEWGYKGGRNADIMNEGTRGEKCGYYEWGYKGGEKRMTFDFRGVICV